MIKLNIGCGADLRNDYINIDSETIQRIIARYGLEEDYGRYKDVYPEVHNYDVFNLPYKDGEVDEILCLGFVEHLSFEDERKFFLEVKRTLKQGGLLHLTVPDFDSLAKQWLDAKDDFQDFYMIGTKEHWFGNCSRSLGNKWGYLTASIFGNQNGAGQFHKNAYTVGKICKIMNILGFTYQFDFFYFKGTEVKMINCKAYKK